MQLVPVESLEHAEKPFISLRLTAIDTVQLTTATFPDASEDSPNVPYIFRRSPFFRNTSELDKVPEIRIWGATERGQRCCLHVHGALPYMYIEYKESLEPDIVQKYIMRLGQALNLAMFYSFRGRKASAEFDSRKDQYIGYIALCKGIPFYGFHVGYRYFLKIYALQPRYSRRLFELLKSGACLPKASLFKSTEASTGPNPKGSSVVASACQVFEAHIPYILQFMLDMNLYGCDWIDLRKVCFRGPLPDPSDDEMPLSYTAASSHHMHRLYTANNVPEHMLFQEGSMHRVSPNSPLEFDCHISDIMNRLSVQPRHLHQDFTEYLQHPIPDSAKLVFSVKGVWEDERKRRRERGEEGPHDSSGEPANSADRKYRSGQQPEWASSQRHKAVLEQLLADDKNAYMAKNGGKWPPDFHTFVKTSAWDSLIPTAFESVQSLFPSTFERDEQLGKENPFGVWASRGIGITEFSPAELGLDADKLGKFGKNFDAKAKASIRKPETHAGAEESDREELEHREDADDGAMHGMHADDQEGGNDLSGSDEEDARAELDEEAANRFANEDDADTGNHRIEGARFGLSEHARSTSMDSRQTSVQSNEAPALAREGSSKSSTGDSLVSENETGKAQDVPRVVLQEEDTFNYGWGAIDEMDFETSYLLPSSQKSDDEQDLLTVYKGHNSSSPVPPSRSNLFSSPHKMTNTSTSSPKPIDPIISLRGLKRAYAPIDRSDGERSSKRHKVAGKVSPPEPTNMVCEQFSPTDGIDDTLDVTLDDSTEIMSMHQLPSPTMKVATPPPLSPYLGHSLSTEGENEMQLSLQTATTASSHPSDHVDLSRRFLAFHAQPPPKLEIVSTLWQYGQVIDRRYRSLPSKRYQAPFYSNPKDVPSKRREYAGTAFDVFGTGIKWLQTFPSESVSLHVIEARRQGSQSISAKIWRYERDPPSRGECEQWLRDLSAKQKEAKAKSSSRLLTTQGFTQANPYGFKQTQLKSTNPDARSKEHMTTLAIEVQASSRGSKLPDPALDALQTIFYCLHTDNEDLETTPGVKEGCLIGCIAVAEGDIADQSAKAKAIKSLGLGRYTMDIVPDELELINTFVDKVTAWDPEIFTGYEIQNASWGYLLERADKEHGIQLVSDLSRVTEQSTGRNRGKADQWNFTQSSTIKITGRHVLPIWRLLKGEMALLRYSFENVAFHVLHQRVPHYSAQTLTQWMASSSMADVAQVYNYWLRRVELDVELLDEAELISHTTEFARIYGVDFASVLNRGSQFKVESVMLRIAKPENFVLLTPTREEVGKQNALEAMPLIAEPQSAFYKDPVVVLDFQSLYPSCMIAYNYCYSTCLGRVGVFKGTRKFGVINLNLQDGLLNLLKDHINVSPNGFIFVKPYMRRSLLAKMLSELLDTRVMVKASMKLISHDKAKLRIYNARQLGLKLLANVTYGYTSATFSGRMPCAEIADAIVQTGRESLERARNIIHAKNEWGADVVYGDTDSLFVWLPGKTKEEALRIGNQMAEEVSFTNPHPVKLKFEKVYLPCVLASKKRYVGFKFESMKDTEPAFDAKGIETVRRDLFPVLQKMLEVCIKILFRSQDLSKVKEYCEGMWSKFYSGEIAPQDFLFAKEVKMGTYSENGTPPPGAVLAAKRQKADHRDEVQYGERVPYLIPERVGGQRTQNDRVQGPLEFLQDGRHRIDARYYIGHTINALNRVFTLLGVDVKTWHDQMPKTFRLGKGAQLQTPKTRSVAANAKAKLTLDKYFTSDRCCACGAIMAAVAGLKLCPACEADPARAANEIIGSASSTEKRLNDVKQLCASCGNSTSSQAMQCDSIECPVLYTRYQAGLDAKAATELVRRMDDLFVL